MEEIVSLFQLEEFVVVMQWEIELLFIRENKGENSVFLF